MATRAAPPTDSESAALLSSDDDHRPAAAQGSASGGGEQGPAAPLAAQTTDAESNGNNNEGLPPRRPRDIFLLTWASILLCLVVIGSYIALWVVLSQDTSRPVYTGQSGRDASAQICVTAVLMTIWSGLNLNRLYRHGMPLWKGPNIIVDMVAAYSLANGTANGLNYFFVECRYSSDEVCEGRVNVLRALFYLVFAAGGALALVHTILAVVRWVHVWKTSRQNRNGQGSNWFSIPAGSFSIEITFKLHRQEPRQEPREELRPERRYGTFQTAPQEPPAASAARDSRPADAQGTS